MLILLQFVLLLMAVNPTEICVIAFGENGSSVENKLDTFSYSLVMHKMHSVCIESYKQINAMTINILPIFSSWT